MEVINPDDTSRISAKDGIANNNLASSIPVKLAEPFTPEPNGIPVGGGGGGGEPVYPAPPSYDEAMANNQEEDSADQSQDPGGSGGNGQGPPNPGDGGGPPSGESPGAPEEEHPPRAGPSVSFAYVDNRSTKTTKNHIQNTIKIKTDSINIGCNNYFAGGRGPSTNHQGANTYNDWSTGQQAAQRPALMAAQASTEYESYDNWASDDRRVQPSWVKDLEFPLWKELFASKLKLRQECITECENLLKKPKGRVLAIGQLFEDWIRDMREEATVGALVTAFTALIRNGSNPGQAQELTEALKKFLENSKNE